MDSNTGGGVTVSTGIAPVELQPNVNVTPVHSESSTSFSTSAPDANTKVGNIPENNVVA